MNTDIKNLIDAKTAGELVGMSPNTILTWAKAGKLACVKRGSRFFFNKQDILDIIQPHNAHEQLA